MFILTLSIFFIIYFFYLYKWAQSRLLQEYSFGSPSPPKPLPHSTKVSILLSLIYGIMIIAGIFWGYTTKPYGEYFSIQRFLLWSRSDTELIFLIILCVLLILSFIVVYHLGELKGVTNMKNTALFESHMKKYNIH
jgi:MFS family permease